MFEGAAEAGVSLRSVGRAYEWIQDGLEQQVPLEDVKE